MPPVAEADIEAEYQRLCATPSDIHEHLPTLRQYADQCEHVTEFGVRGCVSLHAFLASKARKVVAYDIANVAVPDCPKLRFICADVLQIEIEPTDLLFVDTVHAYCQLREELKLHAGKVRRWIALHDTEIFGITGENGDYGLLVAITDFISEQPQWKICYQTKANNGLTILEKLP